MEVDRIVNPGHSLDWLESPEKLLAEIAATPIALPAQLLRALDR